MMAAKQGVSMMHELYAMHVCNACMHDARAIQQVASIKSNKV